MKTINHFLFAVIIACLFISCDKNGDLPDDLEKGIFLEINPEFNSYVHKNGNHFYAGIFESKNDTVLFRLKVEKGGKYHLFCVQPSLQSHPIDMVLFNTQLDTLTAGMFYEDSRKIYYESGFSGDVFLKLFIRGATSESLIYNLYFEKKGTTKISFAGYNWEYTGFWEKGTGETLKLKSGDARKYRWIRMASNLTGNPNISFTIKSDTKTEVKPLGFVLAGSSNLLYWGDYKEELPDEGFFFNIQNNDGYSVFNIAKTGIAFEYGDLTTAKINLKDGVRIRIVYDKSGFYPAYWIYVNDVYVRYLGTGEINRFYIAVEERGPGEITVENFKIE